MKVLHVLAQLPAQTGSGVYFHNLLNGLKTKGVDNGVIYATQPPFKEILQNDYCYPVHFESNELPFSIVGMSDSMPYQSSIYSQLSDQQTKQWQQAFIKRLIKAKKEFQPDIILTHHLWYLSSLVLDIFPKIPVIGISHGTDIRQARRHPHLKNRYLGNMNRFALIFSLTKDDRDNLINEFNIDANKIKVIGNGFNSSIFNLENSQKLKHSSKKIMYAGKITRSKGVFELLLAFEQVKKKSPQSKLFLIGNGDSTELKELKTIVSSHGIEDIHFLSALPQFELAKWMKQSDIFVLPSYYEGLATVCLEAMACGLRAVVSDLAPLKNYLNNEINQSQWIEYVPLPRIIDQDKAHREDIPEFIANLSQSIILQMDRLQSHQAIDPHIYDLIMEYSWERLIDKQFHYINFLFEEKKDKA
ncbi:glycosyltransferase [Facklamia sp. 7083-14-GEN3]|uniref:glycosyltransferase n=1 Tax=Facklamia sp. 7083-14-GEN3 TaxID=2973478 RepID=UPI00215C2E06|nr:glycosyltransferase [Facklamia sp. 7083-14-GEN3]MCR8968596.1 glycosyltransferase [Facklamia sp. 7083-14-GEN3]